ncbi:MAG TPA: hypothetical protein VL098_03050 [Flavipsychrobacter sp.]|nr:hypothetical protein [Flavipsychrobacter sp.]
MTKFFRHLLICALITCTTASYAQITLSSEVDSSAKTAPKRVVPKRPKPIDREFSVGARLNTDGWSLFADKGYVMSEEKESEKFYNIRLFQLEITEHRHAKEIKGTNTGGYIGEKPRPYKFGKVNSFYALKLGYGFRKLLAGKPDPGTVSIHWVYGGGLSVGFLKPYYLDIYHANNEGPQPTRYQDEPDMFLTMSRIAGRSGFFEGIGQTKIVPGIHAKTALHFDFAAFRKRKLAIETGLNAELYTQKIELMALVKSYPFLLNGYIAVQFGNRK